MLFYVMLCHPTLPLLSFNQLSVLKGSLFSLAAFGEPLKNLNTLVQLSLADTYAYNHSSRTAAGQ